MKSIKPLKALVTLLVFLSIYNWIYVVGTIALLIHRNEYDDIVKIMSSYEVENIDGMDVSTNGGIQSCGENEESGACLLVRKIREAGVRKVFMSSSHGGVVFLTETGERIVLPWMPEQAYLCENDKKKHIWGFGCWRIIRYSSFF